MVEMMEQRVKKSPASLVWRGVRIVALSLLGFFVVSALLLSCAQGKLIYFPQKYSERDLVAAKQQYVAVSFQTSQGAQCAFYFPPREGADGVPAEVWLLYCGNASVALDWEDFIAGYPDSRTGFLLVDYPGYGACEGSPSPRTIAEASDAAIKELENHLEGRGEVAGMRVNVLGHSLGAAAALQVAGTNRVEKAVLVSPFTSMSDMAYRSVGFPLHLLLRHRFDNRARLAEIGTQAHKPAITIFHGDRDEVIPVVMSRKLAGEFPGLVTYHEVVGGNHNDIIFMAKRAIFEAMTEADAAAPP